jgi:hypothetical protein
MSDLVVPRSVAIANVIAATNNQHHLRVSQTNALCYPSERPIPGNVIPIVSEPYSPVLDLSKPVHNARRRIARLRKQAVHWPLDFDQMPRNASRILTRIGEVCDMLISEGELREDHVVERPPKRKQGWVVGEELVDDLLRDARAGDQAQICPGNLLWCHVALSRLELGRAADERRLSRGARLKEFCHTN